MKKNLLKRVLLFIKPTGLMDRDMAQGFARAGVALHMEILKIGKTPEGHTVQMFSAKKTIDLIEHFKPDMVFSFNGYGSDSEGFLAGEYAKRGIPYVTWFVDMPKKINIGDDLNRENSHIFVFDSSDVASLKHMGFDRVYHLPLATNPERFRKMTDIELENNVCFIGDSDYTTIQYLAKNLDRLNPYPSDIFLDAVEDAINKQLESVTPSTETIIERAFAGCGQSFKENSLFFRNLMETFVEREASLRLRLGTIERLSELFTVVVYGDSLWAKVVGKNHRGKVNYFNDEVVKAYNRHAVHINISKFQLRRAINQRPFDISACGAFLITDEREDLRKLFDRDEIASYQNIDDLLCKAEHYLKHEKIRTEMANKAKESVLNHHTYRHRATQILETVFS